MTIPYNKSNNIAIIRTKPGFKRARSIINQIASAKQSIPFCYRSERYVEKHNLQQIQDTSPELLNKQTTNKRKLVCSSEACESCRLDTPHNDIIILDKMTKAQNELKEWHLKLDHLAFVRYKQCLQKV